MTVSIDVTPKKKEYPQEEGSSGEILIQLIIYVYDEEKSTSAIAEKSRLVLLMKERDYSYSGWTEVILPTNTLKTVYWNYDTIVGSYSVPFFSIP